MRKRGIAHELLAAAELRARGVELPPGWVALWQPDAGVVLARGCDRSVSRRHCRSSGSRVESLDDVDADIVVVTAGAWIPKLVPDVAVRVTRETIAYFAHDGAPVPSVVELDEDTRRHAMYALHDPEYGLKAGAHHAGHVADPDVDEPADPAIVARIADWVAERFPGVDPTPVAAESCLYTSTRTSRSCSSAAVESSSAPPARATASSSRRPSGGGLPSWRLAG